MQKEGHSKLKVLSTCVDNLMPSEVSGVAWKHPPTSHLEGLSLTLSSPDSQNEGNLDLGQVHEVLGNVDGHLVKEGRGDIKSLLNVVEALPSLGQIVLRAHDGVVGASHAGLALEERIDHLATTSDILLCK